MIDLRLTVNGTQQVDQRLHIMASNISDFSPVFRDIKNSFIRYQRQEFDSAGAYAGYQWAKLTPKYAKWKAKHFPGKRILERSGDLRKDMTSNLRAAVRPTKLIMWSDSEIAGYHQDGTDKMKPRKIVALKDASEKRDWNRLLHQHILAKGGYRG